MNAVRKLFVSMELHLDASINKLDNLAKNVQLDKVKRMEDIKSGEQKVSDIVEAEWDRVYAEVIHASMLVEGHEYQYNADAFKARDSTDVKVETVEKVSKAREDKAR